MPKEGKSSSFTNVCAWDTSHESLPRFRSLLSLIPSVSSSVGCQPVRTGAVDPDPPQVRFLYPLLSAFGPLSVVMGGAPLEAHLSLTHGQGRQPCKEPLPSGMKAMESCCLLSSPLGWCWDTFQTAMPWPPGIVHTDACRHGHLHNIVLYWFFSSSFFTPPHLLSFAPLITFPGRNLHLGLCPRLCSLQAKNPFRKNCSCVIFLLLFLAIDFLNLNVRFDMEICYMPSIEMCLNSDFVILQC